MVLTAVTIGLAARSFMTEANLLKANGETPSTADEDATLRIILASHSAGSFKYGFVSISVFFFMLRFYQNASRLSKKIMKVTTLKVTYEKTS